MNLPEAAMRRELILGGQKSGKSRRAENLAQQWLQQSPHHQAMLIATAQALDGEMRERIARHRAERAARVPGLRTVEEPLHLAQAITTHSRPATLLVLDCLTLWLTNWLMPLHSPPGDTAAQQTAQAQWLQALQHSAGPVVLVSNEISLGIVAPESQVRRFVDALGCLNQQAAACCNRVTLMVAGLPLTLKG